MERKEERGEEASLEVEKQKLNLEKCIEVWMVLGVRWEGTRARVGKVWSSRGWSAKHLALSQVSFFIRVGVGGS